jgi:filamentous hemagglutinin
MGRALEALKKDKGLRNDFHGRILDNGYYIDDAGNNIGSIEDCLP